MALLFSFPRLKADLTRLGGSASGRYRPSRVRRTSWFHDDTWALLRAHGACAVYRADDDLDAAVATAPFGYARLQRRYSAGDLAAWAQRLR